MVVFRLGNQRDMSQYKPDSFDPVWNENFVFKVKSKEEILKVELYDKNEYSNGGAMEGYLEIYLKDLDQQHKVEEWYQLTKPDGSPHDGDIRMRLQFLWSRYLFYSESYNNLDNELIKNKENRDHIEQYCMLLEKKFGILYCGKMDKIERFLDERPHKRDVDLTEIHQIRKSVFLSPKTISNNRNSIRFTIAHNVENIMKKALGNYNAFTF